MFGTKLVSIPNRDRNKFFNNKKLNMIIPFFNIEIGGKDKRAIIYYRSSNNGSVRLQTESIVKYASIEGLKIRDTFIEEPQYVCCTEFLKAYNECIKYRIKNIICYSVRAFSGNIKLGEQLLTMCVQSGIKLYFLKENVLLDEDTLHEICGAIRLIGEEIKSR